MKILNEAQKKEVKLGVEAQKFEDLKKRILTEKETFFLNIHDEGKKDILHITRHIKYS